MPEIIPGSQSSYKLTNGKDRIALLGNNCNEKKQEVKDAFDIAKFGSCNHPTPADADVYALTVLAPQVIAEGGVLNKEAGHKTVTNKVGPISYKTYLSYAAGDTI